MERAFAACALAVTACSGPPAAIRAVSSSEVGLVAQSPLVQGHDGGSSAVLFDRSVWLYGDTVLALNDADGTNWHSNSFATIADPVPSSGLSGFEERLDSAGAPMQFVANTEEEAAFDRAHRGDPCMTSPCGARWAVWPGSAVFDAPRGRALIWYGLVYAEPGSFNFHGVGQSLAVWSDFASLPDRPVVSPGATHPTLLFAQDEPGFGTAAAIDGDFFYSFACDSSGLKRPCTLARVESASALDRASWTYWNGSAWSPAIGDLQPVFDGGLGMTVFRLGSNWLAVYARSLSNDIVARTAPMLTGPWSDETPLFTADRKGDSGWTYDAYVHPELTPADGGALYVSFTRSNHQGWFGSETALVRLVIQ
jgi:hypothetical protein